MNKIILTGYMGSGKTRVARLLALQTGLKHQDLDEIIEEREGLPIAEIFHKNVEIGFRKIEHRIFKNLMESNASFILSLGGGTPCYADNHKFLTGEGIISFYLKASIGTLHERLSEEKSQRPLLANLSSAELKEFIGKHLFERSHFYNHATYTITVDGKSPDTIVAEIQKLLV